MPLDKDNKSHRAFSDKLDAIPRTPMEQEVYKRFDRPIIHGLYHAGRYATGGGNPEEWAQAKDQFSKVDYFIFSNKSTDFSPRLEPARIKPNI